MDARIDQLVVALNSLEALAPPERVYDEDGNEVTDLIQFDLDQAAYEDAYVALRTGILVAGGPGFAYGIRISGYDTSTIPQAGLTACLKVTLQIGYSMRWLSS